MSIDLFSEIRERVPVMEVVRQYGFEPDRHGKICCPFHQDDHPSLQLYKGNRGWWCYVCDIGGSSIDFVARLFSLSPREAALRINADMGLGLSTEPPRKLEIRQKQHARFLREQALREFRKRYEALQNEFVELRRELFMLPGGARAGEIMGRLSYLEYWFQENPWR